MTKSFVFLVLLGLLFLSPALSPGEQRGPFPGDPANGARLFGQKGCGQCHSFSGQQPGIGPDLSKKHFYGSMLELATRLWNHWPQMAERIQQMRLSWPQFTQNEMADVIAYIYYLPYLDEPGDPARGKKLFADKGCNKCHSLAGKGGNIGPSLDGMSRYASPLFIAQAMWNHGQEMDERMKQLGIKRPRFQGKEMVDLLAYIRQAGPRPKQQEYMPPGDPARGEALFAQKGCQGCHAILGQGGKIAPDLGRQELHFSATQLAGIMWNHGREMWEKMKQRQMAKPTFKDREMADLVAYLYFLKFRDVPGLAKNGARFFDTKGCATCHGTGGKGGSLGPAVVMPRGISPEVGMAQLMWNHAPRMARVMSEKGLPWPEFKGRELPDLMAYLKSLKP